MGKWEEEEGGEPEFEGEFGDDFDKIMGPDQRIRYARRLELCRLGEKLAAMIVDATTTDTERLFVCEHVRWMVDDLPPDSDGEQDTDKE